MRQPRNGRLGGRVQNLPDVDRGTKSRCSPPNLSRTIANRLRLDQSRAKGTTRSTYPDHNRKSVVVSTLRHGCRRKSARLDTGSTHGKDCGLGRAVTRTLAKTATCLSTLESGSCAIWRSRLTPKSATCRMLLRQGLKTCGYAERFVRSIKDECLDRIIPIGERHFRQAIAEFVRRALSLRAELSRSRQSTHRGRAGDRQAGRRAGRRRLGGLLTFYERAA